MKKFLLAIVALVSFQFVTAQGTVLSPGDVMIIQYQADTPDEYAFVTFVDLAAGTTIYITDCGTFAGGGFNSPCNEGGDVFVASSAIPAGSVIMSGDAQVSNYSGPGTINSISLSTSGDQLIVFQDIDGACLLYTSPSPRDLSTSRMPSSA